MEPAGSTPLVVTIDGPAGAGKSTVARTLAARLGYTLLDSGAIYRALALCACEAGVEWSDGVGLAALGSRLDVRFARAGEENHIFLGDREVTREIRRPEISEGASRVSAHPEVRAALLDLQRRVASHGPVVAEGRDMGTVVFPHARAKFFLTASPEERARRRACELAAAGRAAQADQVLRELEQRDERDRTRAAAPLRQAEDAVAVDSQGLTPSEVVDRMLAVVRSKGG